MKINFIPEKRKNGTCLAWTMALIAMSAALCHAQSFTNVYLDTFPFTEGDVVTNTSYTPNLGFNATITNESGSATATVTNLFGSTGAFLNAASNSFYIYYGSLGRTYTNVSTRLTWNLMIPSTNAALGGLFELQMTDNTSSNVNSLLGFTDTGGIIIFTNTPSLSTFAVVGNYTPGALLTNDLRYDLGANVYDFFVNGTQIVTNQPIPSYLSADFASSIQFDVNTSIGGAPNAGQAFLDNVTFGVAVPEPSILGLLAMGALVAARFCPRRR